MCSLRHAGGVPEAVLTAHGLRVVDAAGNSLVCVDRLRIAAGETLAIIGDSGAGKSLLVRAMLGLLPTGVEAHWDGLRVAGESVASAGSEAHLSRLRRQHVGYINQNALTGLDPLQRVGDTVAEQILLRGDVDRVAAVAAGKAALHAAGLDPDAVWRRYPNQLSGGMRQRVLVAAAVAPRPSLLVADEPTSALDAHSADTVLRLLARQRPAGAALVFISHDIAAVAEFADRVLVVDAGGVVAEGTPETVLRNSENPAVRRHAAVLLAAFKKPDSLAQQAAGGACVTDNGSAVARPGSAGSAGGGVRKKLALTDVTVRYAAGGTPRNGSGQPGIKGVSVMVREGETVALVGESGSGKTTAARALLGLVPVASGTVRRSVKCGYVPQGAGVALLPNMTVAAVIREARAVARRRGSVAADTSELLQSVLLQADTEFLNRRVRTLSGGQAQRLAIARALAAAPDFIVLDEPVSALDATARQAVVAAVQRVQNTGVGVLLISHEMSCVRQLADRVVVFSGGTVVEEGETGFMFSAPRHPVSRRMLLN